MLLGEQNQIREPHHFAIFSSNLANRSNRMKARKQHQINCCLSMSCTDQYTTLFCSKRKNMTGPSKVNSRRLIIGDSLNSLCPIGSGNTGSCTLDKIH